MTKPGIDPKTLQYLMRHSGICVTLNIYIHLELEDAKWRTETDEESGECKDRTRQDKWKN